MPTDAASADARVPAPSPVGGPATVRRHSAASSSSSSRCVSRCRPFPCDRLSRPRSSTAAPPRPGANSGRRACPPTGWLPAGKGDAGSLPTFTGVHFDGVGAQLRPGGIAHTAHRSLGLGLRPSIGWRWPEREGHQLELLPAPQHDPSARVRGSLTTHGASITGSVALHLSVLACEHGPSVRNPEENRHPFSPKADSVPVESGHRCGGIRTGFSLRADGP